MFSLKLVAVGGLSLLLSGCASIWSGTSQTLAVTVTCNGRAYPAHCSATNNRGVWHFAAPQTRWIYRDSSPLDIVCESTVGSFGVRQPALVNPVSAANYFVGGLVGAGIDAGSDALWAYPARVSLESPVCKLSRPSGAS